MPSGSILKTVQKIPTYIFVNKWYFFERWKKNSENSTFVSCNFLAKKLKFSTALADCLICFYFTSQMSIFCFKIFLYLIKSLLFFPPFR